MDKKYLENVDFALNSSLDFKYLTLTFLPQAIVYGGVKQRFGDLVHPVGNEVSEFQNRLRNLHNLELDINSFQHYKQKGAVGQSIDLFSEKPVIKTKKVGPFSFKFEDGVKRDAFGLEFLVANDSHITLNFDSKKISQEMIKNIYCSIFDSYNVGLSDFALIQKRKIREILSN